MDEEQIVWIYREHVRDVYQFLLYFTGNRNDAEDLTQEVFLRVLKALPSFDHRSGVKTWLFSIAKHVAVDHYRKRRLFGWWSDSLLGRLVTQDGVPERALAEKEDWRELEEALRRLKPKYRLVVILRHLKECSVRETAEILGCSEAKVKVDHHRALKMLQERMKDGGGDQYGFAK